MQAANLARLAYPEFLAGQAATINPLAFLMAVQATVAYAKGFLFFE